MKSDEQYQEKGELASSPSILASISTKLSYHRQNKIQREEPLSEPPKAPLSEPPAPD